MKKVFAVLVAVLGVGTVGYVLIERMQFSEALLSAAAVVTTNGVPHNLSNSGKLFTTALMAASIGIIIAAVYRSFNPPVWEDEEALSGFFSSPSQSQNLIMKELKVGNGSPFAGQQKSQIIRKCGVVVVGIKHKGGFDLDVPLGARVKSGSSILVLGTPATVMAAEKRRKLK